MKDPIRSHEHSVGEATVRERTGRTRTEWFALLDAAGAAGWTHRQIAEWLGAEHAVTSWWCQSLAVGYEQARGTRSPGQRADGTFEAGSSVTVPAGVEVVFPLVADPALTRDWLDVDPPEVRGVTAGRSVRWTWADGTRVEVRVTALRDSLDGPRTRVTIAHRGLTDAGAVGPTKAGWHERLDRLKAAATRR